MKNYSNYSKMALLLLILINASLDLMAEIAGSPHDLSKNGWGTTETCKFCHTPHAARPIQDTILWNRDISKAVYELYISPSFNGAATIAQPSAASKMCLSCHDGTVALDSYSGNAGSHFMSSTNLVGSNNRLNTDHPISFEYSSTLAAEDRALILPSSQKFVDSAKIIPLYNGKMECSSCHDAHDNTQTKFLRVNNSMSALCLKCHIK